MSNATLTAAPYLTTIAQMGGSARLSTMVGAKNFVHQNEGRTVSFKFSGSKVANYVKITIDLSDTYTVEFGKIRGYNYTVKAEHSGIYADQLRAVFERETGLFLSI